MTGPMHSVTQGTEYSVHMFLYREYAERSTTEKLLYLSEVSPVCPFRVQSWESVYRSVEETRYKLR